MPNSESNVIKILRNLNNPKQEQVFDAISKISISYNQ